MKKTASQIADEVLEKVAVSRVLGQRLFGANRPASTAPFLERLKYMLRGSFGGAPNEAAKRVSRRYHRMTGNVHPDAVSNMPFVDMVTEMATPQSAVESLRGFTG